MTFILDQQEKIELNDKFEGNIMNWILPWCEGCVIWNHMRPPM